MKTLEIGKDYGFVFGLDDKKGMQMIYNGGDSWTAKRPGAERTITCAKTTAKVLEYINRPTIRIGSLI